jgi:hypothetical protein
MFNLQKIIPMTLAALNNLPTSEGTPFPPEYYNNTDPNHIREKLMYTGLVIGGTVILSCLLLCLCNACDKSHKVATTAQGQLGVFATPQQQGKAAKIARNDSGVSTRSKSDEEADENTALLTSVVSSGA